MRGELASSTMPTFAANSLNITPYPGHESLRERPTLSGARSAANPNQCGNANPMSVKLVMKQRRNTDVESLSLAALEDSEIQPVMTRLKSNDVLMDPNCRYWVRPLEVANLNCPG